jgi:hypothetical protein
MQFLKDIFYPKVPEERKKTEEKATLSEEKKTTTGEQKQVTGGTATTEKKTKKKTKKKKTTKQKPATTGEKVTKVEPGIAAVETLPATKQETIRHVEIEKVQPVIHRQREQTEIKQVIQPIEKKVVAPSSLTVKEEEHIDLGRREEQPSQMPLEGTPGEAPLVTSKVEKVGTEKHIAVAQPKVTEVLRKNIVEQIQPVILQETVVPHVTEQTQHFYEKVVEKPVVTHEIKTPIVIEVPPPQPPQQL